MVCLKVTIKMLQKRVQFLRVHTLKDVLLVIRMTSALLVEVDAVTDEGGYCNAATSSCDSPHGEDNVGTNTESPVPGHLEKTQEICDVSQAVCTSNSKSVEPPPERASCAVS